MSATKLAHLGADELLALLGQSRGSVQRAARKLRITRQALWYHVKKHAVQAEVREMVRRRLDWERADRECRPRPPPVPRPHRPSFLEELAGPGQSEADALRALLERHAGCVVDVARELDVDRRTIWKYVRRHDLGGYVRGLVEARKNTYRI